MKEIDHDPKEPPHRKFPDYDQWVKKDYPNGATPMDLVRWLLPIAILIIGLQIARNGWPF